MAFLDLSNLQKSFGGNHVVKSFDLGIGQGEFVSLLGPSGCGKTTVLRMVAGFETPSAGAIVIDGQDITTQRPNQRNIGMVFQAYALFPNLTVAQNVGFGLRIQGVAAAEARARVAEMLALIGLPDLGARYPYQLSGGQQQRVALARALAPRPRVLLLDEPLSALDAKIRVSLRAEIREIQQKLGITTIFVTHDQEEALSMSDRVVVMNDGRAEQIGTPFQIYSQPSSRFVANFVGTLNTLSATILDPSAGEVGMAGQSLRLSAPIQGAKGSQIALALRPEALHLQGHKGAILGQITTLPAEVTAVEFMGAVIRLRLQSGGQALALDTFNRFDHAPPMVGDHVAIEFNPRDLIVLAA